MNSLKPKTGTMVAWFVAGLLLFSFMPSGSAAAELKQDKTCGCKADDYVVYGAGVESCQVFLAEFDANTGKDAVDPAYAQTIGWIAGYISATNRKTTMRDVFDMGLDYVPVLLSKWCRQYPDRTLSEAMDALSDEREKGSGWLSGHE